MPAVKQRTVEIDVSDQSLGTVAGLSKSDSTKIAEIFPNSPIHKGDMLPPGTISPLQVDPTDGDIRNQFQRLVMDGPVMDFGADGIHFEADSGYNFNSFNRDYDKNGAPDMTKVPVGNMGLPASPYVPNPSSAPTTEPSSQHIPPKKFLGYHNSDGATKLSRPPFIGEGTVLTPHKSSERTSSHLVGQYLMGKSINESIGSYTVPTPTETSAQDWIPPEAGDISSAVSSDSSTTGTPDSGAGGVFEQTQATQS